MIETSPRPMVDAGREMSERDNPISLEVRTAAVRRILESTTFSKSPRLLAFLSYVSEQTLSGSFDELSEQQVGVRVFGRPTTYNPGDDNIVRTTARQLRQRIALFYQEEGKDEVVQLQMPRGGYAVVFARCPDSEPTQGDGPGRTTESTVNLGLPGASMLPSSLLFRQEKQWWMLVASSFAAGVVFVLLALVIGRAVKIQRSESAPLWGELFARDHRTILSPGDAGLNLYNNAAQTQVSLEDYLSRDYLRKASAELPPSISWAPFADRRYTTTNDLSFADRLRQEKDFRGDDYEIRFARDLTTKDFRGATNVILLGSAAYQPWVQLFQDRLNFRMNYDGKTNTFVVTNQTPAPGEQAKYTWSTTDPNHRGYATISLLPNLDDKGIVLLVQGTTIAGMDGASNFIFDNAAIQRALTTNDHGLFAGFELLLETRTLQSSSPEVRLIAKRMH